MEDADVTYDYRPTSKPAIELKCHLYENQLNNRFVQSLDYSRFSQERIAAGYDHDPSSPLSPPGIIALWNLNCETVPENILHAPSRLTSMVLDSQEPNVIFGGCYSGQICLWDIRINQRNPVCKTKSNKNMHVQPICFMMQNPINNMELVTLSRDGLMCSWSIDSGFRVPLQSIQLTYNPNTEASSTVNDRMLQAISMSVCPSTPSKMVVGSENSIYIGDRHSNGEMDRHFYAHDLPISAVHVSEILNSSGLTSICLSSSFDFTVKLWNLNKENSSEPLRTFHHKHFVVDVKWSPSQAEVFSSACADGTLNLWNLKLNENEPVSVIAMDNALAKMMWTRTGNQICVGDINGSVRIYDVQNSLCCYAPFHFGSDDLASTLFNAM
ncbi:cytoplasmic dynein 1 intermediate chain 2 [Ditylenchus destructor]|uniref:Cytoplasmic dynein 1 intermediate chain 2 n=1 Tax=Ditylenchus destructor TaxID=166010 RepID=A0AAD4R1Q2_9BILA|nr:cytoplasmic dynein 1 intermediate chain 2 [Ditylenchus destructor]